MSSMWGDKIKISLFGESHGRGIGVVIDGLPANFTIDFDKIEAMLSRRKGGGTLTTKRQEADGFEIISGVFNGKTNGAPLCAITFNGDTKSEAYDNLKDVPRPSHSDYVAAIKYSGANDIRGGGHFSARLTAPLVFAGAIATQILKQAGIQIAAHLFSVKDVFDTPFDAVNPDISAYIKAAAKPIAVLDDDAEQQIVQTVASALQAGDSVGGIVECIATGVPCGLGNPIFDGVENKIASILFGIPALKGLEFGNGFESTKLFGSQNNDAFCTDGKTVSTKTNNCGGILGGITSGMPLILRAAFKPTPSIGKTQQSVDLKSMQNVELDIKGRHDPCVALRAVPCVEAAVALALLDIYLLENGSAI